MAHHEVMTRSKTRVTSENTPLSECLNPVTTVSGTVPSPRNVALSDIDSDLTRTVITTPEIEIRLPTVTSTGMNTVYAQSRMGQGQSVSYAGNSGLTGGVHRHEQYRSFPQGSLLGDGTRIGHGIHQHHFPYGFTAAGGGDGVVRSRADYMDWTLSSAVGYQPPLDRGKRIFPSQSFDGTSPSYAEERRREVRPAHFQQPAASPDAPWRSAPSQMVYTSSPRMQSPVFNGRGKWSTFIRQFGS